MEADKRVVYNVGVRGRQRTLSSSHCLGSKLKTNRELIEGVTTHGVV